jgi:hypothetical protein
LFEAEGVAAWVAESVEDEAGCEDLHETASKQAKKSVVQAMTLCWKRMTKLLICIRQQTLPPPLHKCRQQYPTAQGFAMTPSNHLDASATEVVLRPKTLKKGKALLAGVPFFFAVVYLIGSHYSKIDILTIALINHPFLKD